MNCPHRFDGAAYVLGALGPSERAAFDAHLADCAECAAIVRDVTALPGMLAHVDAEQLWAEPPAPPADVLPGLFRRVRRDRRRRRIRAALATAAAILVVAGGSYGVAQVLSPESAPVATGETLTAELAPAVDADVWGSAEITAYPEGTQIRINCEYSTQDLDPEPSSQQRPYRLVVTNTTGDTDVAGSWHADNGTSHHVTLFSRWEPANIAALDVQDLDGQSILIWRRD